MLTTDQKSDLVSKSNKKVSGPHIFPAIISSEANGSELKGIIYKIKNTYGVSNPISKNIVVPRSIGDVGSTKIENLVLWNNEYRSSRVADS